MKEILKEQRHLLAAWLIAEFFCALLAVGMSLFMKQMSDTAYSGNGLQEVWELMRFGIVLALLYLALEYAWRVCRAGFLRACNLSLKKKIFGRIVRLDIHAFHEDNNGKYISLLNNDLRMLDQKYFRVIPAIYGKINMLAVALILRGKITMGILLGAMQIGNYVNNPAREISSLYLEYRTIQPVLARISAVLDGAGEDGRAD